MCAKKFLANASYRECGCSRGNKTQRAASDSKPVSSAEATCRNLAWISRTHFHAQKTTSCTSSLPACPRKYSATDITGTFLYVQADVRIAIKLPPFTAPSLFSDYVGVLKRNLYGFRQGPKAFHDHLDCVMQSRGWIAWRTVGVLIHIVCCRHRRIERFTGNSHV